MCREQYLPVPDLKTHDDLKTLIVDRLIKWFYNIRSPRSTWTNIIGNKSVYVYNIMLCIMHLTNIIEVLLFYKEDILCYKFIMWNWNDLYILAHILLENCVVSI